MKMFIWRLVHNSLAVRRNLRRRGMKVDTLCPMCQRLDEDPGHLFFKCRSEGVLEEAKSRGIPDHFSCLSLWKGYDADNLVSPITDSIANYYPLVEMVVSKE